MKMPHDREKYQLRQKLERHFNKIKHCLRSATRYEKLARTVLAFVHIVSSRIILRQFVNTTWRVIPVSIPLL